MPQLDKFTYFTQFFWLCLFLFTFYIPMCNDRDGVLRISIILKLRNQQQQLSNRGIKIRSNDPNCLEDILRKGFRTGGSYMYSSLFEVSQCLFNPALLPIQFNILIDLSNRVFCILTRVPVNVYFYLSGVERYFVRRFPANFQFMFFVIFKSLCFVISYWLASYLFSLSHLWMDDLSRAVAQFYPTPSGGMSGGFGPPPGPTGDSSIIPMIETSHDQPGPSEGLGGAGRNYIDEIEKDPFASRSLKNARKLQEGMSTEMYKLLKMQDKQIDYKDVRNAVDIVLTDTMENYDQDDWERNRKLRIMLQKLTTEGSESKLFFEILNQLKEIGGL